LPRQFPLSLAVVDMGVQKAGSQGLGYCNSDAWPTVGALLTTVKLDEAPVCGRWQVPLW